MMCDYWKLGAIAALALTAGACARDADRFPSLALRPGEIAPVAEAPEPEAPIRTGIDPARITALRERAAQAHAAFKRSERAAAPLAIAATGQSMESNARAAALVALADLRSKRGATAAVLADIDEASAEAATALAPDPALTAAQFEVLALLVSEDEALAEYWRVLAP
jgi:hypothetical protein